MSYHRHCSSLAVQMGGTDKYEDRGLIPRTLTHLFDWITASASTLTVALHISYLEIYNDKGFDLLDPQHEHKTLEELPRVTLLESDGGSIHFRNLGELPAANVDEALNLLFVGDTNRVVCETPSNDSSTRSHCIFMISLEVRELGGSKVRRSKLNLVDLAGSERVKKTGVGGKILNEALHINVSLHYLEQVIVALHEARNGKGHHIPYRNSMLTSVLRDSLGGNCKVRS
jgi:kinesin family protein 6/9